MVLTGLESHTIQATDPVVAAEYPTSDHARQAASRLVSERIWAEIQEPADTPDPTASGWWGVVVQQGDLYAARVMLHLMHDVDTGQERAIKRMPKSWWSSNNYLRLAAAVGLIAMVTPAAILVLMALELIDPIF